MFVIIAPRTASPENPVLAQRPIRLFTKLLCFPLVLFHICDVRTQAARVLVRTPWQALPMFAVIASQTISAENSIHLAEA